MATNDFAQVLRDYRVKKGLTQDKMAKLLGVSYPTLNHWEAGKSKPQKARFEVVMKIIEADEDMEGSDTKLGVSRGGSRRGIMSIASMEQMLWDAACSIRGQKDAPKFKDYIFPLLFIKRLSDVFDDEVARLADTYGERDTALKVLEADHSLVRFYIPLEARWNVLSGREKFDWPRGKTPKTLGEQVTMAIRAIVKFNPTLAGVIDRIDFNESRHGEREISDAALKKVIEQFSDPKYRLGLRDVEPDFLGRCYEYLLRKFAEGQGQAAGEFFTPTEVGFLIAELMRPRPGEECYDYACGSFGLLIKLQLVSRRLDPLSKIPLKLYGQELQAESYAIASMNKIIHDMEGKIERGDSMVNPKFRENNSQLKKFDIVVANPMWNQSFDPEVLENDAFNRFESTGGVTNGRGDWAWLQHTLASMKDGGRAAVVLDTGAVTRGSGSKHEDKERNIRKWFIEQDLIEGVILLPDNLFYNTGSPGVIILLRKNKPKDRKGTIVLINASQEFKKGAPKNYLAEVGIKKISDAFAKGTSVDKFVSVISSDDVAKADFNLLPSAYIQNSITDLIRPLPILIKELKTVEVQSEKISAELNAILKQLSK